MRTTIGTVALLLILVLPLAAQPGVPAKLKLKGDPAQDLDLGATRLVPMPVRKGPKGPVVSSPYVCLRSTESGLQTGGAAKPRQLLGRPASSVMPWLNRLDKMKPSLIWSQRWTLVCFLKDARVDDLTPEETVRLRVYFPKLPSRPTRLTGHERAHLWAIRMLRTESGVADLLDLDERGELKSRGPGYRPLPHKGCELYMFSSAATHDAFRRHIFKPSTKGLAGETLDSGPVTAMLMDDQKSAPIRRRFLHAASLQLIRAHRRLEGGIPAWLEIGVAHYFERRQSKVNRFRKDESGTLPPGLESPRDWDQAIRDLVAAGRSGELTALSATPERGLTVNSRLQSWSLVKYLLGVDGRRFRRLLVELLHTRPGTTVQDGLRAALKASYGHFPKDVEKAWKSWVIKRGG
ncbi:MAG: hypothetical protein CMJ83_03515 [Planctomycetes bacterium]|nr:hypothetical protein [Planctomycetota bacterium]